MYKFQCRQTSIMDFGMPLGLKLDADNRWVKKAHTIPWDAIEARYAELFKERKKGNVAKPLRLALGALIIQTERRVSDEEVVLQIQETPCLQYFCGLSEYTDKPPFHSSSMVHFRKRLTPEILGEINEMIIGKACKRGAKDGDDAGPPPDNSQLPPEGDLIVDSTCAPQNIRYPQDFSLLNEARENLEMIIDALHNPADGNKPRTYRQNARNDFLRIARKKNKSRRELRKAIGKQLRYIRRNIAIIMDYLAAGKELSAALLERFETICRIFEQQACMYKNRTHQVADRIVSISQPWVRPIVRGKARTKCEFGAKLDISVSDGFTRLEYASFDAYNESGNLTDIVERHKERTGHYPARVLVDKIYRTRENLKYCSARGIRMLGSPLGRPRKDYVPDKKQNRKNEIDRIEVERKFSLAKAIFGLGLIRARLQSTSKTAIALSILALNIAHAGRLLRTIFHGLLASLKNVKIIIVQEKMAFVQ